METEWWYDDATFHYSGDKDIHLARLTVNPDGSVEVLTASNRLIFSDVDAANEWLTDEEFSLLENLAETFEEAGRQVDHRIKVPYLSCDSDLATQLVIKLA